MKRKTISVLTVLSIVFTLCLASMPASADENDPNTQTAAVLTSPLDLTGGSTSGDGYAWDSVTNTLTLNNLCIDLTGNTTDSAIKLPNNDTTVIINGSNKIIGGAAGIDFVSGSGTVTIKSNDTESRDKNSLIINSSTVAFGINNVNTPFIWENITLITETAGFSKESPYGITFKNSDVSVITTSSSSTYNAGAAIYSRDSITVENSKLYAKNSYEYYPVISTVGQTSGFKVTVSNSEVTAENPSMWGIYDFLGAIEATNSTFDFTKCGAGMYSQRYINLENCAVTVAEGCQSVRTSNEQLTAGIENTGNITLSGSNTINGTIRSEIGKITIAENAALIVPQDTTTKILGSYTNNGKVISLGTLDTAEAAVENAGTVTSEITWAIATALAKQGEDYELDESGNYTVLTARGLAKIADVVNSGNTLEGKTVILKNDIDLKAAGVTGYAEGTVTADNSWTPIGNDAVFIGTFDGQEHTVSGLYINDDTKNYVGLFGHVRGAEIKNLKISASSLTGNEYVGGIVAHSQVHTSGDVSTYSKITNCITEEGVTITGNRTTGGIAGQFDGTISNCANNAAITVTSKGADNNGNKDFAGGIVGYANNGNGAVINCVNNGEVKGIYTVGGIAAQALCRLEDCTNNGNVTAECDTDNYDFSYVGGITGNLMGTKNYTSYTGELVNCVNTGNVTATGLVVGGAVGYVDGGDLSNVVNRGNVQGTNYIGGIAGVVYNAAVSRGYSIGEVSAENAAGGIAGNSSSEDNTFSDLYFNNEKFTGSAICNDIGTTVNAAGKPSSAFASGEVAHLLHGKQETQTWGQSLGEDEYPVLTSDRNKAVYKVTFIAQNNEEYAVEYANPSGLDADKMPEPPADTAAHAFYKWAQKADGDEFTGETPINSDITVYAFSEEKYGEKDNEKTVTTTYGILKTQNLSEYTVFAGETSSAGKFTYTIENGNETLGAEIDGDILTVPDTAAAGDYTLTIKASEKEPQISLMSVNFGTEPVTFDVTVRVNKANPTVTAPEAKQLVWTGEPQELVTEGSALGGTIKYSLNGANYTEAVPTAADAGEYTVYYMIVGDSNHNDTEPKNVMVTIAPPADFEIANKDGGIFVTVPKTGTYTLIFTAYENGALKWVKTTEVTFDKAGGKPIDIPDGFTNGDKCMLWDNLSTMTPLCTSINIE